MIMDMLEWWRRKHVANPNQSVDNLLLIPMFWTENLSYCFYSFLGRQQHESKYVKTMYRDGLSHQMSCILLDQNNTEEHINVRIPKSQQNNNNKTVDVLPVHG